MNYYEYAPPFLRWLHYTGIKPWQLFALVFWGSLLVAPLLLSASFVKTYKKRTRIILFVSSFILIIWGTRLDKYYLNYEQHKICSIPAIYIKKQVPANGYVEMGVGNNVFTTKELLAVRDTPPMEFEDIWIEKEPKYCEKITEYRGYHFNEKISVANRDGVKRGTQYKRLDPKIKGIDDVIEYASNYVGVKNGICYQGYLNKAQSRYYLMTNIYIGRIGLGTERYKSAIFDSLTGEEIAHSYNYVLATNALSKILLGGFGSTNSYCGNGIITTEQGNTIREYRKAFQSENNEMMMRRYALIPDEYFYTQQTK